MKKTNDTNDSSVPKRRNKSKDKMISKSPLKNIEKTEKNIKIKKNDLKEDEGKEAKTQILKANNLNNISNKNTNSNTDSNSKTNLTSQKINNEKELRDKLDNEMNLTKEKEMNIKELQDKIQLSLKNQEELKKQIESANEKLNKKNKIVLLYKTNDQMNKSKIKKLEEKIKILNSQLEKPNNENINSSDKAKKDSELVSGTMYKLGEIFWESKTENYILKAENVILQRERLKYYNGDF